MTHEKIRDFFIKYSDRILFGTDTMSPTSKDGSYKSVVEGYIRVFEAMETDKVLPGGFSSLTHEIQGIALPMDVLEKIYFRNTVKLYPRVKDVLKKLGYIIE